VAQGGLVNIFKHEIALGPGSFCYFFWRNGKSIQYWRRYARRTIFTFSFSVLDLWLL